MSKIVQPGCIFTPNAIMCSGGGAYERGTWDCPECGKWWPEEGRAPRPFRREAQQHFEALWEQCAPDGSTFAYEDEGYLVVTTPDGTRHTAWTAIGADDQPALIEET